jgi:hypothetical protein
MKSWPRTYYEPGGGDANLFYKVHGRFAEAPEVSRSKYRTDGVPAGCDLQLYTHADEVHTMGLEYGWIAHQFRDEHPALCKQVLASEQCLVLRGEIEDPPTLDYFRDAVGLVMALLDAGGIAVFDPHMFKWWNAEEWRTHAFEPDGAVPRHHAVILVSDDWYHTRGMRKFGRPDLSIHGVTAKLSAGVEDLCNRMIEMQAFGAVIPEGQPIKMKGLPAGWRCHHGGDLDDPDFNNRHIEIR